MSYLINNKNQKIAYKALKGKSPGIIFLHGLNSDMHGIKALSIEKYAKKHNLSYIRFDCRGHGKSFGNFEDFNITDWKNDTLYVIDKLTKFLPIPRVIKNDKKQYLWSSEFPQTIGRLHSHYGNFGILVRAYVYIKTLGESGLKKMTRNAIINANYLKHCIKEHYEIPFSEGTLQEFVASGIKQKNQGVKVLDIAKTLLDYGFHAPTIYFPNNVPEALMIEPTESETIETLDRFADALIEIDNLITTNIDRIRMAPLKTPVSRLDETKANRELDLTWNHEK